MGAHLQKVVRSLSLLHLLHFVRSIRDIGICLVGQLRGVCGAEDLRSFVDVFLRTFQSADLIFVVPDDECARARELGALLTDMINDIDIYVDVVCAPDEFRTDVERQWLAEFPESEAGKHYFDKARFKNTLLPARHLGHCADLLEQHSVQHGGYRWLSRARPDVLWHSFITYQELERSSPPLVLMNFVPMPIQGVVEDQFSIGESQIMLKYFHGWYPFLLNPSESWRNEVIVPWCVEHATLRSKETCNQLFTENLLEVFLRYKLRVQVRKRRAICFDKIAPCRQARTTFCDHLAPNKHEHGYIQNDPEHYMRFDYDWFLTTPGVYADFDGQLAARLAHFFQTDVRIMSGGPRPARVLDIGCGRGSYVEVLRRWGLVVSGVDGDAVIGRTLPRHSVRWDLTEPLDFVTLHESTQHTTCQVNQPMPGHAFKDTNLTLIKRINIEGVDINKALTLLHHCCCDDFRCAALSVELPGGTLWGFQEEATSDADIKGDEQAMNHLTSLPHVFYNQRFEMSWSFSGDLNEDLTRSYGKLFPRFGLADWVLCLGVGQDIPRDYEVVFFANLLRHAELGIVISWGTSKESVNPKSNKEVIQFARSFGVYPDGAASRELRLFAGLGYGGPRNDLLVFRRLGAMEKRSEMYKFMVDAEVVVKEKWAKGACTHGVTYGLLTPSRMWVKDGCGGLFTRTLMNISVHSFCISIPSDYKECHFQDDDLWVAQFSLPQQKLEKSFAQGKLFPDMDPDVVRMHAAADHLVPQGKIWKGNTKLNVVYFKFARRLTYCADSMWCLSDAALQLEWSWFWRTEWRGLIQRLPSKIYVKRSRETQRRVIQRLERTLDVFSHLSRRTRRLLACNPRRCSRWRNAVELFERAASHMTSDIQEAAWRSAALAQRVVADLIAERPPEKGLKEAALVRKILPAARRWMQAVGKHYKSRHIRKSGPTAPSQKELDLQQGQVPWNPDSAEGWYLYRLAACDFTV